MSTKGFEIIRESDVKEEKVYIANVTEPQAYALGERWKILPHPEDIYMLPDYRKYVLGEDLTKR